MSTEAGSIHHDISHAANGVEQRSVKRHIDLGTEAPDRDLHHAGIAVEVHIPHLLSDLSARKHFPFSSQKQRQEQKFLGSQLQTLTTPGRFAPYQVQFKVRQTQLRGLCGIPRTMGPPEQHLNAGAQFGKRKGLDQIVVSTRLESQYPILDADPCCQHQDRRLLGLAKGC